MSDMEEDTAAAAAEQKQQVTLLDVVCNLCNNLTHAKKVNYMQVLLQILIVSEANQLSKEQCMMLLRPIYASMMQEYHLPDVQYLHKNPNLQDPYYEVENTTNEDGELLQALRLTELGKVTSLPAFF